MRWLEKRGTRFTLFAGSVLIVAVLEFARRHDFGSRYEGPPARHTAWSQVRDIAFALRAYYADHEKFPQGGAMEIGAALKGGNPKNMSYVFEIPRNGAGEFMDPWGAAYLYDVAYAGGPRVWSCGPDGRDDAGREGSDDVTSWR